MDFANLKKQYLKNKNIIDPSIKSVLNNVDFILGKEVLLLENKLSNYTNSKYCIAVSSGTDALLISLLAINLKKNDEVIIPNFNYVSSIEVVRLLGAKPILIDVNENNLLIDESLIEKNITSKTKAIIPSSLFGLMPNYSKISKIKKKYRNITLIEDAAQSFGSSFKNKMSCNITDISCTSFFPTKILGGYGDSGAIFTNSKKLYTKMKYLRSHGQLKKYNHKYIGLNSRMDTLQASILISKLKILKHEIQLRKKIYNKYVNFINKNFINNEIQILKKNKYNILNYSYFTIIVEKRSKLIKILSDYKIPFNIYYPKTLSQQKAYYDEKITKKCKISVKLTKKIISLPLNAYINKKELNIILYALKEFKNIL
tara:strand:+ start:14564 stop:15676 length:1113 start_codon:yes stop_codon:yes gene_type:complete